ncbi:MAG TPA: hypothetical protein VFW98_08415 [Gemmatimonadaceae bacterium]|nr:hypothetical protein [Gemmatimonadaceae bacterium]
MSRTQCEALRLMQEQRIGAVRTHDHRWVWHEDVRQSERDARAVVAVLGRRTMASDLEEDR